MEPVIPVKGRALCRCLFCRKINKQHDVCLFGCDFVPGPFVPCACREQQPSRWAGVDAELTEVFGLEFFFLISTPWTFPESMRSISSGSLLKLQIDEPDYLSRCREILAFEQPVISLGSCASSLLLNPFLYLEGSIASCHLYVRLSFPKLLVNDGLRGVALLL
ncbi:hypothetical protein ANAPC5_01502 [Anaplasma phagocytophilum]|nr:hypothetical protein ANAPC5_01502 [Anaplasma phagocytophilum]